MLFFFKTQTHMKARIIGTVAFTAILLGCIWYASSEPSPAAEPTPGNSSTRIGDIGIRKVTHKMDDGDQYTFFYQDDMQVDFVTKRPDETDKSIQICIPGAFTDLSDDEIDGVYMNDGKLMQKAGINKTLGGLYVGTGGKFHFVETQKTKLITDSLITALAAEKGDMFQQIYMVVNGKVEPLNQPKMFQRRAIVIMNDGSGAIVENVQRRTLKVFCDNLVKLGVKEALYVDMGAWDEGWYRDEAGKTQAMGLMRIETNRQSNWVIFKN